MAEVELQSATVHFGATVALDGVDLAVDSGEILAVLGPSGSGKSTMLRAIAGLQRLDSGRVLLQGTDQTTTPAHGRGVGLMFQDHALFPHHDVAANIAFGLRMQRRPAAEIAARVAELLALVDLAGFGDRRVQTLSGGEQQRVALARSLAPRPRVLLLDEPLGALDRTLRERLVTELRALLVRLGLTVVAVTHDQREAFALAQRVAVMDAGRVLQVGEPADLWARPASRRVAELLGFTNLLDVEVRDGRASTPFGDLPVAGRPEGVATLVIRPSGVLVDPPASGVTGLVSSQVFQGEHTLVRIDVAGAGTVEALLPSARAPGEGRVVRVGIDPDAVIAVARDDAPGVPGRP